MISIKSRSDLQKMRFVGRLVAEILDILKYHVKPGISTTELNHLAEIEASKRNAIPAFKGYCGYPFSLCCSPNSTVVHGMPTNVRLKEGDILSIDFGLLYDGFYGDSAITVPVGNISKEAEKLLKVTEESLYLAIDKITSGNRLSDVSNSVQKHCESNGYSVVRDFVGHGIGKSLHEDPQVPNYGKPGKGPVLKHGMVLAVEPMINQWNHKIKVLDDGWTAVTVDGGLSAHFEHTIAVLDNGSEILTRM